MVPGTSTAPEIYNTYRTWQRAKQGRGFLWDQCPRQGRAEAGRGRESQKGEMKAQYYPHDEIQDFPGTFSMN